MPSFDIVSEVDLQEARNAVDNASREVELIFVALKRLLS